ncbi:MAG: hypothetical protein H6557_08420 [Lewinellaceae bacterium]|nr:hypothetical protein [Phaeodactylibacter sp.]MCB9036627.1 hypothetical protein [Lewinellaceae bacterium]
MVHSRFQFTYTSEGVVFSFLLFMVYLALIIFVWVETEVVLWKKLAYTAFFSLFVVLPVVACLSLKRVQIDSYRIILTSVFGNGQRVYTFRELDGIYRRRHPDGSIERRTLLLVKQGRVVALILGYLFENFDELMAALPEEVVKKDKRMGEWDMFKAIWRQGMWV